MRRTLWIASVCVAGALLGLMLLFSYYLANQKLVRKVKDLPEGRYWGLLREWHGQLFLIYPMGKRDAVRLLSRAFLSGTSPLVFPFPVARIDADTERMVRMEEFGSEHLTAVAITAERERRSDSWLAKNNYEDWVIDANKNLAYALKSDQWMHPLTQHLHVVDLKQKKVVATLPVSRINALALSPDGEKLYVASETVGTTTDSGYPESCPGIAVISTNNLTIIKELSLVSGMTPNGVEAMVFTKDGKRLFCGTRDGIYVVDAEKDELEMWTKTFLYTNTQGRSFSSFIALSPDEKELYAGLRRAEKGGAVVAIDVAQKKVVRKLELSKTGCTSVAVAKEKLFAACLDGVYVIDIDRWRSQEKSAEPSRQ